MFRSFSKRDFSCLKDATLELRVRTVKYFKDMWQVFGKVTYNAKNWSSKIGNFCSAMVISLNYIADRLLTKCRCTPT